MEMTDLNTQINWRINKKWKIEIIKKFRLKIIIPKTVKKVTANLIK